MCGEAHKNFVKGATATSMRSLPNAAPVADSAGLVQRSADALLRTGKTQKQLESLVDVRQFHRRDLTEQSADAPLVD